MPNHSRLQGFTLLEILVALLVLAIIATMGVVGLQAMITTDSRQETITDQFAELQFAYLLIQRDLAQVIQRPIIDSANEQRPAFFGISATERGLPFDVSLQGNVFLDFTRDGVANPQQLNTRTTLQRLSYTFDDTGKVRRYSWLTLDRVPGSVFLEHDLLAEITDLKLTYFDRFGQQFNQWATQVLAPPTWLDNYQSMAVLPAAMEWRFQHARYGEITWLFLMPGADYVEPTIT
jgi:general secretion pathway protein J